MKALGSIRLFGVAALLVSSTTGIADAQEGWGSRIELSVLGGVQNLHENDTALPDNFINIPAVGTLTYHVNDVWALEGEFTWMIPVEQSVDLGPGMSEDRKTPDILAYQGNLRATWPAPSGRLRPYAVAGAGAVTFLSNTDPDRLPQIPESETAFGINFGIGTTYGLDDRWSLRLDLRELAAFPSSDAVGLSANDDADTIWMERGTFGLAYRF